MEPKCGETVTIRFRTWKDNVDRVYFISGALKKEMQLTESEETFDYYSVEVTLTDEPLYYYFDVRAGKARCFYNKLGVSRDLQQSRSFCIVPGFSTPKWAKGAVMYQIFTDRFFNGDLTNDVENREYFYIGDGTTRVKDWDKLPAVRMGIREFYGGDLQGVLDKLDYLQELGVEVIYFNPLFVSPSNHKYDIQDYDYIDPHFGKIVKNDGELMKDWETENKYAIPVYHTRDGQGEPGSMRISSLSVWSKSCTGVACGSFWTVCLITVVPSISGWTVSVFMKTRRAMSREPMSHRTAHTATFFKFHNEHELAVQFIL